MAIRTRRRSIRTRTQSKTSKQTNRITRKTRRTRRTIQSIRETQSYEQLKQVLTYMFKSGERDIRQKDPNYTAPTADEFLTEFHTLLRPLKSPKRSTRRSKKQTAGSISSSFRIQDFAMKAFNLAVGSFESRCSTVLTYVSMVVWGSLSYVYAADYFTLPQSELLRKVSDPANTLITMLQQITGTRIDIRQKVDEFFRSMFATHSDSLVGKSIRTIANTVLNSQSYSILIDQTIACILLAAGEDSCRSVCTRAPGPI